MKQHIKFHLQQLWDKISQVILGLIQPHPRITDTEERYLSQMLNSLLVMYVPLAVIVNVVRYLMGAENIFASVAVTTLGLVVVAAIYLIGRAGYFRASVITTVILGFAVIYINAVVSRPPHFAISYLIFIPLIGIVLFNLRQAVVIYGITVVLLFIFIATTPTMGEYGRVSSLAFVMLSIGFILFATYQRDRLENNRRELAVEKEQAELLKELINNVSHDFRTPLATIRTSTYLLQKVDTAEKRERVIERIDRQTTQLEHMVDNLLTMFRLDNDDPPPLSTMDVNLLLDTIISRMTPLAQSRQIELEKQVNTATHDVVGNTELLEIMLVNLIENAIIYSPEDTQVTACLCQNLDDMLQIKVIDTGNGIAEADLDHIFDRFYRVDKARTSGSGGNGLGLPIVKQIVTLHHGTIDVQSKIDEGTVFTIQLPIHETAPMTV